MGGKLGPQETKNGKLDYRTSSDSKLIRTPDYQDSSGTTEESYIFPDARRIDIRRI